MIIFHGKIGWHQLYCHSHKYYLIVYYFHIDLNHIPIIINSLINWIFGHDFYSWPWITSCWPNLARMNYSKTSPTSNTIALCFRCYYNDFTPLVIYIFTLSPIIPNVKFIQAIVFKFHFSMTQCNGFYCQILFHFMPSF